MAVDDDQFEIREDIGPTCVQISTLLANDSDADGDALTATDFDFAGFPGEIALDGRDVCFVTAKDFAGAATFTYRASDGRASSAPATVTISVVDVLETPPVASDDEFEIAEDVGPTCIRVDALLANDADPDGDALAATDFDFAGFPGEIALDGSEVCFVTAQDFAGAATFTYRARGGGLTSAPATVTISVLDASETTVSLDGDFVLVPRGDLDLTLQPTGTANRSAVVGAECSAVAAESVWRVTDLGGGVHSLVSASAGKALETYARSPSAGDPVNVYRPNGRTWQQWEIRRNGDATYRLVNVYNPNFLTLTGSDRAIVSQALADSRWRIIPAAEYACEAVPPAAVVLNGEFVLHRPGDAAAVVRAAGADDRDPVVVGDCADGTSTWRLKSLGDDLHTLVDVASGKALETYDPTPGAGDGAALYSPNGRPWQEWRLVAQGAGVYALANRNNPLPLTEIAGAAQLQAGVAGGDQATTRAWTITAASDYGCPASAKSRSRTAPRAEGVAAPTRVFPTKVAAELTVEAARPLTRLEIYGAAGALVRSVDAVGEVSHVLPVGDLPAGGYWVRVETAGESSIHPFIRVD